MTNPEVGDNATWRWAWGNSFLPELTVGGVPADGTDIELLRTLGFIYEFHQIRTDGSGAVIPEWDNPDTFLSPEPDGTLINHQLDVLGTIDREGWWQGPGAIVPGEGLYAITTRYYNQYRTEQTTTTDLWYFGVDRSKPRPVEGLTSSVNRLTTSNGWTEASWRDLRWTRTAYDDLSGIGGFNILVNGKKVGFAQNHAPTVLEPYGPILNWAGSEIPQISQTTIEDLPAGSNVIGIVTVDRATNESAVRTVVANVDPDTPKVSITAPAASGVIGINATLKCTATDAAGISAVKYFVDDHIVATSSTAPYSANVDLSAFASGTHTLKVEVFDRIGAAAGSWNVPHTASATRSFRIDKTVPSLSIASAGPTPFYPRKREGYKDNFVVKLKSSEAAKAKLVIKDSNGKVWQTLYKNVPAGSSSMVWNGKSSSGSMKSGSFKWYLQLTDAAGNRSSTRSGSTSIRYYEIVQSSNTVRIIQR